MSIPLWALTTYAVLLVVPLIATAMTWRQARDGWMGDAYLHVAALLVASICLAVASLVSGSSRWIVVDLVAVQVARSLVVPWATHPFWRDVRKATTE